MRELGLVFIAIYIYIGGFFSNSIVTGSYPGRVSGFLIKPRPVSGFFLKTHTQPYSLSGRVKSGPLGSGRAGYPQVRSKLPSLLIQHFIQYHTNISNIIQEKNIIQTQGYLIDHLKSNVKLSP